MFEFIDLGPAQIAAVLVLIQRGIEELHSKRNTRMLLEKGASESGAEYYPVVAGTHLGWIAALFFIIPGDANIIWPAIYAYLGLQVLRYWIIFTLGPYWTHRIISLPDAPIEKRGPYAFVRHPNYVITIVETFLLPICFGAYALGIIFGAVWFFVLRYKIVLEDQALSDRRHSS